MNRFIGSKTILELYTLVNRIKFTELTQEEAETMVAIFNANLEEGSADAVEYPLTKAGYDYIYASCSKAAKRARYAKLTKVKEARRNTHCSGANAQETTTVKDGTAVNFKEEITMNNPIINLKAALEKSAADIAAAKETVKVKVGEDTEEFKAKADDSITTCKNALMSVLSKLDELTGATALKESLLQVLYDETKDTTTARGFFDAASECRRIVYRYIDTVMAFDPDEYDLQTVAALRYMLAEDEEGKPTGRRSIFTSFTNTVVWVCRKVSRTFKRWFGTDASTNIFGSVGASLASIFGVVAGVLGSALKVALHTLIFVGSYIVTAVIKAVAWVWDMLKKAGNFVKSKVTKEDVAAFDEDVVDEF